MLSKDAPPSASDQRFMDFDSGKPIKRPKNVKYLPADELDRLRKKLAERRLREQMMRAEDRAVGGMRYRPAKRRRMG